MQHRAITSPWKIVRSAPWSSSLKLVRDGVDYMLCACVCGSRLTEVSYENDDEWTLYCVGCGDTPTTGWDLTCNAESELWAALAATMVPLPPDSLEHR